MDIIDLGVYFQVVRMLLKLLEDKNGEVQNLAIKCLGPLTNKVKEPQVNIISLSQLSFWFSSVLVLESLLGFFF